MWYKGVWFALTDTPRAGRVRRGVRWIDVNIRGQLFRWRKWAASLEREDWKHSGVNEVRPLDHTYVCVWVIVCVCTHDNYECSLGIARLEGHRQGDFMHPLDRV